MPRSNANMLPIETRQLRFIIIIRRNWRKNVRLKQDVTVHREAADESVRSAGEVAESNFFTTDVGVSGFAASAEAMAMQDSQENISTETVDTVPKWIRCCAV